MPSARRHHRSDNTYHFQTFSERLALINIDVVHRIDRVGIQPEDVETYFSEGVQKWREMHCTAHYDIFLSEVSGLVHTFPQLVYHQDTIVQSLQNHLLVPNSTALEPLLDLVVQLVRDLQKDFYPHFRRFFFITTGLLDARDPEQLEWVFTCLSYLFKFLWRLLIKDIHSVYSMYSPLLEHKKEHIRHFAAESFSFLMRKVPNHGSLFDWMFLDLILSPAKDEGVGQLLFQMCRGVKQRFHSCTEQVLQIILSKLGPATQSGPELPWALVFKALQQMLYSMACNTTRENCGVIWDALMVLVWHVWEAMLERQEVDELTRHAFTAELERSLQLVLNLSMYRKGLLVTKPEQLQQMCLRLVQDTKLPETCQENVLHIVAALLLGQASGLRLELSAVLVKAVFESPCTLDALLNFSQVVFPWASYEETLLPYLLPHLQQSFLAGQADSSKAVLIFLAKLILNKVTSVTSGSSELQTYPLIFQNLPTRATKGVHTRAERPISVAAHLLGLFERFCKQNEASRLNDDDLGDLFATLVVLPHVRPFKEDLFMKAVCDVFNWIFISVIDKKESSDKLLFVLQQATCCLLRLDNGPQVLQVLTAERLSTLLRSHSSSPSVLLLVDLVFARMVMLGQCQSLASSNLLEWFPFLQPNLSSDSSRVRFLTLRILNHFHMEFPLVEGPEIERISVFAICIRVEETPATLYMYREKLLHLHRLRHDLVQPHVPVGPYQQVPLRFLLGMLYVNFSHLWKPTLELITSYAKEMDNEVFWETWWEHIQLADAPFDTQRHSKMAEDGQEAGTPGAGAVLLFQQELSAHSGAHDRPDHANFRLLIWQAMLEFPEQLELHSHQLVPLLFTFIRQQFSSVDVQMAHTQDVRRGDLQQTGPESEDVECVEEMNDAHAEYQTCRSGKRLTTKDLLGHLKVFSKFSGPWNFHKQEMLKEFYYRLLCHRNQDVQKVALACLFTYKPKALLPYREHLERLLEDHSFKEEIVLFMVQGEACLVQAEHRQEVMQVLIRMLFGRLRNRTGRKTKGKSSMLTSTRTILQFLSCCTSDELSLFFNLLLEPLQGFLTDGCLVAARRAAGPLDLGAVVPLGRQLAVINSLESAFRDLGHTMWPFLPRLLQVLICVIAFSSQLLLIKDEVQPGLFGLIRLLRQAAHQRLSEFFVLFEFFNFSQEHIDALFEFVIWPWVSRLTPRSSSFSMALLQLASIWSKQPRYFPLFAKQSAEQPGGLLPVLFSLLGAKPTAPKTTKMVLNIVWSLLTTPDFQPSENMPSLPTGGCFSIEIVETPAAESLSLGSQLVRPHVSTLLQFLAGTLQAKGKWEDMSYNLDILSQLSGFVENEDQSNLLVGLLIPYLNKGMLSQDIELSLLEILLKLIPRCRSPSLFLQPLSRLICLLKTSPSRQKLCTLFQTMGELDNSVAYITEAIIKMNALDRRHVDDVDYDVRLQALQYAATFIGQMDPLEESYLIPVISCCFYNIQLGEMSLSDSGGLCLSALLRRLKTLSPGHPTARLLLQSYLLPNLRKGLRSETEGVQQECTRLLSDVVQILPALTESKAMLPLVNVDPEADFFENIRHIQGYRRARALTRLARRLDEGSISIAPAILQGYFIPFAARMLQDDGTIKNENILVNAGIELLRAICRQLPWKQYLPILRRYQHGLHNKKISLRLSIRLLVAVLDAFHFDHETLLREEEEEEERVKSSAEAKTKDDLTEVIMNEEEGAPTGEEERKDAKSNDCSGEQTKAGENPKRLQKQAVGGRPEGQVVPKGSSSVRSGRLASEKIRHTVERVILPHLLMSLSAKSKADSQHKMVKSFGPDDELVARIPLALSAVHLLQALPPFAREQQLPSILLKVCLLLRNRLERVREIARTTLSKILQVLGPPYLFYVLREMSSTLSKGYQSRLQRGDLDTCAKLIQETCNRELFGDIAETKRVPGILRRVVEARACRSYAVYQTLSRFLSCGLLTKLISPLKEVVDRTGKYETIAKVQEVLRRIVQGLMENTAIAFEDLILLSHSLVTQSLPFLSVNRKGRKKETNQEKPKSCLLLPPSPKRGGEIAVVGVKTNSHVMVEFGLQVLKCSLRKRKLMGSNKKALEMLDPFVPLLCNCLESQHIPVITLSLCCLECVLSFEIPALHESSVALTRHLFSLLKNYASTGAGVGDNFVLVLSCFKTITAMLRNRKCDDLSENQLQVLLGYVEEDMHDNSRQATAFSLLKAILDRKLMVPEMNDVMKKVAQMSIYSHVEPIRVQCRKVYLTFIMEYPLERKLQEHLEFIISQLEYEHDTGRESALEILMTMFKLFPEALVEKHSGVFFLPLALMLGKESGLQTRKMAGLAIRGLLDRLRPNCRVPLFKLTSSWLHSPKVTLRRLAVQVCGLFADVERLHFEKNLPGLLPVLHSELEAPFDSQMNESMERASDQLLFSVLSLLSKLLHICPVLTSTSRHKIMINIWESVQRHLLHPQAWVRLQAGQLFGQLFESWTPEKLVHGTGMLRPNFLVANLQGKMEELARAFSLQLKSPLLSEELSVQIRQNILFVMKVCHHLDSALEFQENEDEGEKCKKEEDDVEELKEDGVAQGKRKCLAWILGRLSLITRSEAACTPHIMFKRTCVFHVFSNLAISLGKESTIPFLRTMLQPLFRELGNTYAEQDATLKTLALETIDKLKDVVGREEFSLAYNAVHQRVKELRVRRKMLQAQQAVSNPDIAARRKMKKHLNKIQSKKRKAEMHWVGCKRKRRRN